jgi:hypothetical protein
VKEIVLKYLSETLFIGSTRINIKNTIVIDDNPEKCVYNDSGNYLFFQTWTYKAISDDFFLRGLAPWLLQLHTDYNHG